MVETGWTVEPFDRKRHDRTHFDCGVPPLNHWLKTKISQFERRNLSRAYVLVRRDETRVDGFYTISSHSVSYEILADDLAKGLTDMDVPVVLSGKLAIDKNCQGRGLGEKLLYDALRRAEHFAQGLGIQAVEVTAIDETAKRFYEAYGFRALKDDSNHLLIPMRVVQDLKLPPLE